MFLMRKGILEELNKSSVTVTDIANQSWCEYKVFLSCTQKEGQTKAMRIGEAIHMNLQKEVYKELSVEPVNYPDVFYKNAYENILTMKSVVENGKGRELKIEGDIDGFTIRGKIDELLVENGETVIVENKTTNRENGRCLTMEIRIQIPYGKRQNLWSWRIRHERRACSYACCLV